VADSDELKIALVGCGRIGVRHAQLLSGSVRGLRLVAVCDSIADRAANFAGRFAVPGFGSIAELVAKVPFEIGVVATPSGMHAAHAMELLRAHRHVVVEKPMALTLADADAMVEAADAAKRRLFVVKQNRFNLPVQRAREALESGRFGKLVLGSVRVRWCRRQAYYDQDAWRGTWALDGGVLANQASHHVDLLHWMFGDVESVCVIGKRALVDVETEDTATGLVTFTSGALGIVEATTAARPTDLEGSLSILGEKGTVEIGGFAVNEMRHWRFEDTAEGDAEISASSVNPPDVYGFGHHAYYDDVVRALRDGTPGLVEGRSARRGLELLVALYESMATERRVHLPLPAILHTRLGTR
jgi:predicted dehydrogenase